MKKLLIAIPVLLILLLAAAIIAPSFIDWEKYKPQIINQAQNFTGYEIEVSGAISLAVLPSPKVQIEGLKIVNPQAGTEPFVTLDKVSAHMALGPLFKGEFILNQVVLDGPNIDVRFQDDGTPVWMSAKLQEFQKNAGQVGEAVNAASENAVQDGSKSVGDMIALREIRIRNGAVAYTPPATNGEKPNRLALSNIDATLRGDTLMGPYDVSSEMVYNDQKITIKLNAGRVDQLSESIPLQLNAALPAFGSKIDFAGVVSYNETIDLQGETAIDINKPKELAQWLGAEIDAAIAKPVKTRGVLSYDGKAAHYRNLRVEYGATIANGSLSVNGLGDLTTPLAVAAEINVAEMLDLDSLMPPAKKAVSNDNTSAKATSFMPQTISMPVAIGGTLILKAPQVNFQSQTYRDLDLALTLQDNGNANIKTAVTAPGNTSLNLDGDLSFSSRSVDAATKAKVLSGPSLKTTVNVQSDEPLKLMQAFSKNPVDEQLARILAHKLDSEINSTIKPTAIAIEKGYVTLHESRLNFSGDYTLSQSAAKNKLAVAISAFGLNLDTWRERAQKPSATVEKQARKADIQKTLNDLALPFDLDFSADIQNMRVMQRDYTKLLLRALVTGNQLKIQTASLTSNANDVFTLAGSVADYTKAAGVDLSFSGKIVDLEQTLQSFGVVIEQLPSNIGQSEILAELKGNADKLSFVTNLNAIRGTIEASGAFSDILTKPVVSDLTFRAKHPNYVDVVRLYNPAFTGGVAIRKSMDVFTSMTRDGDVYRFPDVQATIGPSVIKGNVEARLSGAKPQIKATMAIGELPIDKLLGLEAQNTQGATRGSTQSNQNVRWSRNAINTAALQMFDVDFQATADQLSYGLWALDKAAVNMSLKNGVLDITQLDGGFSGGQIALSAKVASGTQERQPLNVNGKLLAQDVQLQELVRALSGSKLISATGKVTLDTSIQTSGLSPAALVFALQGQGKLDGDAIVFEGFDLARLSRALGGAGSSVSENFTRVLDASLAGGNTKFDSLDGAYTIKEGVVNVDKMILEGEDAIVNTTGDVNLPLWTVNLTSTVQLKEPEDAPPLTASFKGPLDRPAQTFGQNAMNQFFKKQLEGAVLNPLLENIDDGGLLRNLLGVPAPQKAAPQKAPASNDNAPPAPQAQPSAPSADDQVDGLIRGLLGVPQRGAPQAQQEPQQPQPETEAPQPAQEPVQETREPTPEEAIFGIMEGLLGGN